MRALRGESARRPPCERAAPQGGKAGPLIHGSTVFENNITLPVCIMFNTYIYQPQLDLSALLLRRLHMRRRKQDAHSNGFTLIYENTFSLDSRHSFLRPFYLHFPTVPGRPPAAAASRCHR